ncbi:MFS-type efflux pump MSMEG_3705-like isoform X2 [Gigantopelta aegis]|uniref:MFS-type efflux pump MSMEG_3705-like isoform X2 n=2 Tax=Gigantopelta aegis TaxID=1735272 RepID=UPI001B888920|nr:MFS-type efflux pump MSMEG_3705-like isoform X2 [Gigantopelta aegis]
MLRRQRFTGNAPVVLVEVKNFEKENADIDKTNKPPEVATDDTKMADGRGFMRDLKPYNMYVLFLLLITYLLNQLDRYMLAITSKSMAQDVHFGDQACMVNTSFTAPETKDIKCNGTTVARCDAISNVNGSHVCKFDYNGQGWDYQILAGPVFILIYTFMGILIGFAADIYNRKVLLAICLIFWSAMTLLTGFVTHYWQLVILRFGLGMGEAGCTPFAASIITDYFSASLRGAAMGVYNWGIYFGYSMSYAVGNFITLANINDQGWRWAFFISGIPGLVVGIVILLTMKEPERTRYRPVVQASQTDEEESKRNDTCNRLKMALKAFLRPSLIILCIAGSFRNSAGYVWAYNTQLYFNAINQTKEQVGMYMSWIPLVGGSIGVVLGGFISDVVVYKRGLHFRVIILVASQILAAPFAAGTLFLDPPYAFLSQIPTYIIGEMWVGVTLTVLVELVPSNIRTSAVAVYLFIISNVGGAMPLLVPPIQQALENNGYNKTDALRGALYVLYPGLYVLGSVLFLLTMFVLKRDQKKVLAYTDISSETGNENKVD